MLLHAARLPILLVMCGLPASGKTTAAERIHAAAGGALIRSCDVYRALGIDLPAWVRRTRGFTRDVGGYERARDRAYVEMARRLEGALRSVHGLVVVDAVHGERAKREVVSRLCEAARRLPVLVWCRCDDLAEVERRFEGRRGRERVPENEASDLSVFRHVAGLWEDPVADRLADGRPVPLVEYDTLRDDLGHARDVPAVVLALLREALGAPTDLSRACPSP